ncbi:hypothetical protein ANCDUO_08149 [Ancylostoma duodenale]|uniref:HEAT repeat protein n=1 Tax=Ancylostoma duodenale TaxID=51022 RepID=A0A0C2DGJ5_9BILA|nr:hypothetical protein ANCDUO_08149 [Ancylostoma duodenale]
MRPFLHRRVHVSLLSLEILQTSIDVSGDVLAPYLLERVTNLVERLADTKPQVREAASCLLIDLANVPHSSHEAVLERMSPGFQHKQYLVRIGTMDVFVRLLDESVGQKYATFFGKPHANEE